MPSITELPCEVVAAILRRLDHLRFLPSTLLASRHFYTSFRESHGVEASILRHQVTPALLPYSVALMEASRLPRPLAASSVLGLLDELYSQPARLAARVPALPTSLVRKMSRTHDAIHALATDFAASAWARISPGGSAPASTMVLSPTEYFRFCRAFYRVELFYTLFRSGAFEDNMNPWFFSRHAPWENEQLGCVYEQLEAKFAEASLDVVAHDVEFGELSIDYLTVGGDNQWRQTWLSHGVESVYKLTTADSYDAKYTILQSTLDSSQGRINLPEALCAVLDDVVEDGRPLAEHAEEELHSIAPPHADHPEPDDDTDQGPYQAWLNANADVTLAESLMLVDNAWLRERAYVLWDGDRVQTLRDGFGKDPGDQAAYSEREYEEMLESFDARSEVWQKGGRGYWSRGDTSRVVWPDT